MGRLLILLLLCLPWAANAAEKVAFFGLTMLDQSLQTEVLGEQGPEAARLGLLEDLVRTRFEAEGFELVDLEPARANIERHANLAKCYGCDSRIALDLGARFSLVGEVQKVSELILAINLQMRDAASGNLIKGGVVDIRGNTDDSWLRGMRYILKNRFFPGETKS